MEVSQRRVCGTLGQPRSTQRYQPRRKDDEGALVKAILDLVGQHPRFGYRRVWALLKSAGWQVNRKRVYRLWRKEGLKVPLKRHKRRRLGTSENGCARRRPEHKDHVWAWDFIHDRTEDSRPLKWLSVVDEFTRECLALETDRSITSEDVIDVLMHLFCTRGVPEHIRSDNGPEFIARALRGWLKRTPVETLYVEPGAPWENGFAEAFHSRLRDEFLNVEEFATVREAKVLGAMWRSDYNERRPHGALGYRTPAEFARACVASGSGSLRLQQHTLSEERRTSTLITSGT
jgi:putative transposase